MPLNSTALALALQEAMQRMHSCEGVEKRKVLAIAIGRSLALSIDLPPTRVYDIGQHFHANVEPDVCRLAGGVNEIQIIDTDLVCATAKMIYTFRYNMTYEPACFASLIDRCATWSDKVLPESVRECVTQVAGNQGVLEAVAEVMHLLQNAEEPILFKKELMV